MRASCTNGGDAAGIENQAARLRKRRGGRTQSPDDVRDCLRCVHSGLGICKPLVGSSKLSPGTNEIKWLSDINTLVALIYDLITHPLAHPILTVLSLIVADGAFWFWMQKI
jgi:hypothetical protein